MATAEQYAQWIVNNADKKGSKEFAIVEEAYRQAKQENGAQPIQQIPSAIPEKEYSWSEIPLEAAKNLPSSLANLAGGVVEAVTNPLETADTITKIGAGVLQNVLPESLVQYIGEDKASRDLANRVGKFYVDRYGSIDGFKRALAEDPAGVLGDVATILGGTGVALRAGGAANVAEQVSKASQFIEPLSAATKATAAATGGAVSGILGRTTGVGAAPISEAFTSGLAGGERAARFREGMRSGNVENILQDAKQNLSFLRQSRNQQYAKGMKTIEEAKAPLSFKGIDEALDAAIQRVTFKGQVTNKAAADAVSKAVRAVEAWKGLDPAEFHTPIGMDALKQQLGGIIDELPMEARNARETINQIYNAVKTDIVKQAPVYSQVMKGYSEATDLIREIEKTLSLKPNASVDTQIRKLSSVMRNNVNTNFGQRAKLIEELEGKPNILKAPLAGAALSDITPKGIQGATMGLTGIGAYGVGGLPVVAGTAVASSPRLIGEAAHAAGMAARPFASIPPAAFEMFPYLKAIKDPRALMAAYQSAIMSRAAGGENQ